MKCADNYFVTPFTWLHLTTEYLPDRWGVHRKEFNIPFYVGLSTAEGTYRLSASSWRITSICRGSQEGRKISVLDLVCIQSNVVEIVYYLMFLFCFLPSGSPLNSN